MLEVIVSGKSTDRLAGVLPFSRNIYKVAVYTVPCTKKRSLNPYLSVVYVILSVVFSGLLIR